MHQNTDNPNELLQILYNAVAEQKRRPYVIDILSQKINYKGETISCSEFLDHIHEYLKTQKDKGSTVT